MLVMITLYCTKSQVKCALCSYISDVLNRNTLGIVFFSCTADFVRQLLCYAV